MRRRWQLVVELILVLGSVVLFPLFQSLAKDGDNWFGSVAYYPTIIVTVIVGFALVWRWEESKDKSDIDELEDRLDNRFDDQNKKMNQRFNALQKTVGRLSKKVGKQNAGNNSNTTNNN
jgi:hypothetical protein